MKWKTPGGIWALRGVTATIAVIVILVMGTVFYSAYEDYTGVRPYLGGGALQSPGRITILGSSEIVSINVTVPNRGLYTLNVTVTCKAPSSSVVCDPSNLSVPAGQQGVLRFKMTVLNTQEFASSSDSTINGTVTISLEPFATLSIGVNLGGFINAGGA